MVFEWYIMLLICGLSGVMLFMLIWDWLDRRKAWKDSYVKDKDWLLMEDDTKDIYNTSFAKARYIRPGSYVQDINSCQPIYDESTCVIRIIDNYDAAGEPCSVSPITLSDELKETIKKQKGEN
jgi:hypothetical protein